MVEAKALGPTDEFCSISSDTDSALSADPSARVVRPRRIAISTEGHETSWEVSEGLKSKTLQLSF